ncbi:vacuolar protein sorting-associated protein 35B-like [Gossypium australe]|uniref:Vacuolar protein sorting-associated protein 35B-like n=1 Tax=Gossypium australe TaxID=47621 RepID=A0A5B6WPN1_9ROSI|nr:vacuolar protein sorting-associated protein 35B-like [Gossypium australe]
MKELVLSVVPKIILLENALISLKKRKFRVQDWEALIEGDNRETREVERVVRVHPESRLEDLRVERLQGLMSSMLAKKRHPLIMSMPVESTEFVIKVSNPLGKSVLVDKANLMLLPFDKFDIILDMDWLTTHDVTVNCGKKYIELRCKNGDTLRVESDE